MNYALMEQHQFNLLKVVTEMDRITDELYTDITNMMSGVWAGDAQAEFESHRVMWDKTEKEMGALLHAAAEAVGIANANYQQAERDNMRIWADPTR
ncbi:WXG100 family type VII secretion target [Streptosporangium lutulentum]|uniref:Uncharacterized protein YukE n=1 Tax=Streptosporangium lutulentum TaxID=1461250 RepID=A0ABT9QTQ8_9ACTN|nr:WXG100 family type VII secretion target [Streptosporangium lutulentum]MDP9849394.1 uncharacterized protein YukE [Streptosporangium lutulentum]